MVRILDPTLTKSTIFHHFQPVYDITSWKRIGFEVLLRSKEIKSPEEAFETARKDKKLYDLDTLSIYEAIASFTANGFAGKDMLFLNVFPSTIVHKNFMAFIREIALSYPEPHNLILEISEAESINNIKELAGIVRQIKQTGIKVAFDDIGKGFSDIESIIESKPDYIKLDKYFTRDLDTSKEKQLFVEFIINYCERLDMKLVIEGIEKPTELAIIKYLGGTLAQGYVLGYPDHLKNLK
ncbi:EAL domain-containing protein [Halobacillus campisalis]|uniref:EAL domain-containing protein n=1 Tax=Halobacillus campisalis TaxID=435909 RepID=A0ABW2K3K7_9BACI|nr:EAL domain-containing protein [Halobacillus campisalis]